MRIIAAHAPPWIEIVRRLFLEYSKAIDVDLCFQNFEQELAMLPGRYAPPEGRLLLAVDDNEAVPTASVADEAVAGCVALRKQAESICEMKRLYVRPDFRGGGVGRLLVRAAIEAGAAQGYQFMRLDTVGSMRDAISLYRSLGFQAIQPYYHNPEPGALFLELPLQAGP